MQPYYKVLCLITSISKSNSYERRKYFKILISDQLIVIYLYIDIWQIARFIDPCTDIWQIDRCRPYFLCLMGERFGWSQKAGTDDKLLTKTYDYAIENEQSLKWIDNHRYDTSVTQVSN